VEEVGLFGPRPEKILKKSTMSNHLANTICNAFIIATFEGLLWNRRRRVDIQKCA